MTVRPIVVATPSEKLAASLAKLQEQQTGGRRVFRSRTFSRVHRERLIAQGFLREVAKGWLMASSPDAGPMDSTPWYASFWQFCAAYCGERFGDDWHLSPEQSVLLHAESTTIPQQVIVCSPKGTNNSLAMLFDTSLYDLKQAQMPPSAQLVIRDGLRLYTPAAALLKLPEAFFNRHPVEAQVLLASIKDPSELLTLLLEGGHSIIAARLAGAFRRIGRPAIADEILKTMKSAGFSRGETDPFEAQQHINAPAADEAPIARRLRTLWEKYRAGIAAAFPAAPGLPGDRARYLRFVDEIYQHDAYHSLSIEGYRVTPELIERVRAGNWNPDNNAQDRDNRDVLAARGYWQAFQAVKENITAIVGGADGPALVRNSHRDWYREMFSPSVAAGLMRPATLAGYRNDAVFLRGSRHVPPRWEAIRDAMPAYFDLLHTEPEPSVRAVLGHWMFGYVHPYFDGNGRMARFLMNAMLASGGYPWTVIRVEDRMAYMDALEAVSVGMDMGPFTRFMADRVRWSLEQAA